MDIEALTFLIIAGVCVYCIVGTIITDQLLYEVVERDVIGMLFWPILLPAYLLKYFIKSLFNLFK